MPAEGIVWTWAEYRPGRGREWPMVKCINRQEFVLVGWIASDAPGRDLRSLLLGYYQDGKLILAGKVGTGFTLESGREMAARLRKIGRADPPFASVPREYRRGVKWVQPQLVVEVAFTTWTADGILRHPSFQGLREDKPAKSVTMERT